MELKNYYYTRSTTCANDSIDESNQVINLIKLDDGKLVTPDNDLFVTKSQNKFVVHNIHNPDDKIDMDESDKYFIEIAWFDRYQKGWFSAILVPTTWDDVLKCQELCEGSVYMSKKIPRDVFKFKELYGLSGTVDAGSRLIRYNVEDVKISLETGAEHVYISRGINSGILMSRKYENMINKSELNNSSSLVWISGWKLTNSKSKEECVSVVKSPKHYVNMYK